MKLGAWWVLLASSAALGASPIDPIIDEAGKEVEAGGAAGAVALLDGAAKQAPRDPRPHYLAGAALAHAGKKEEAVRAFRAALALNPRLAKVHNELGIALQETGH